jgi:hypothetical protein
VVVGAGAFVYLRGAATPVPARPAPAVEVQKPEDIPPVFLSVVSEPLDADVIATWKDGEKRGPAPLSLEVPRNAKVHFEFRKAGFVGYAMDVIADQPQTVQATLKVEPKPPEPAPAPVVVQASEKKTRHEKRKTKKDRAPKSTDGVVDVLDDLK